MKDETDVTILYNAMEITTIAEDKESIIDYKKKYQDLLVRYWILWGCVILIFYLALFQ